MKTIKVLIIVVALFMPFSSMADCCCRNIVDYMIIFERAIGGRIKNFNEKVKEAIEKGWQPFGSVAITRYGDLYQVMVKYEKVSE